MKEKRVVLGTDIETLASILRQAGAVVIRITEPPEVINSEILYVFAYNSMSRQAKMMLPFMRTFAGKEPNFLAFCSIPCNGYKPTDFGQITVSSAGSIYMIAQQASLNALRKME